MAGLSPAGLGFAKCTLASPDFGSGSGFVGIPDEYEGRIVSKRHQLTQGHSGYNNGYDQYYVQLPIPGIAYFYGERGAGTTGAITLTPVFYTDTNTSMFPVSDPLSNVSSFRYASNALEIISTTAPMYAGGSVQAWKGKVVISDAVTSATGTTAQVEVPVIGGIGPLINSTKPTSVFPLREGIYIPAFNSESTYQWTAIESNIQLGDIVTNQIFAGTDDNSITFNIGGSYAFTGIGNFEATVVKIPAIPQYTNFTVRAWACVEYQVSPKSILFEYAMMSPAYDPAALALVKAYYKQVPCGVTFKNNAVFWDNFIKWVSRASKTLKYVPGPVGAIASGVSDLIDVGHGLW